MSSARAADCPGRGHALDLLASALDYTGNLLGDLPERRIGVPTPCRDWDLERLLEHMEDALDAFTEAAGGTVRVEPSRHGGSADRPARLRRRACALLGTWSRGGVSDVRVGELHLAAEVLVPAAALEIAVHGWDLAQSVGGPPLPAALAVDLVPVAALLVPPGRARAGRFDPPPPALRGPEEGLLSWLGREALRPPAA